jgi:hypothetical protein
MKAEPGIDEIAKLLAVEVPGHLQQHHVEGVSIALIRDRKIVLTLAYGLRNAILLFSFKQRFPVLP